ncbi:B-box zinc finger protein 32-like [Durio zibethinus]|uniref:B-box zinc finger protein 32-like n=1 Tax=Durio zibethinus TaxID=66656 RepID=A0A6P5WZN9_DURZI|nr:B-box zinc finger protein 32-like [Durio zibethinus]
METGKLCELCKEEAFVYCWADAAFLCWNCDYKVHHANFLVARHLRHILCTKCKSFCQLQSQSQCKASSFEEKNHPMPSSTLSFSSSDSLSTNESSATDFKPKRVFVKSGSRSTKSVHSSSTLHSGVSKIDRFEGTFAIWCKKLALNRHSVASTATSALRFCLERLAVRPIRLSLAAAFWIGLRMSGDMSVATWQNLRRLEELSGVPAKLIVAMEPRLARAMRLRRRIRQDLEEGWAECNL